MWKGVAEERVRQMAARAGVDVLLCCRLDFGGYVQGPERGLGAKGR